MSASGNRWACAILVATFVGTTRFSDFQKLLAAPPGSVADRPRRFRDNDIPATTDKRREYLPTTKGRVFFPVVTTASHWTQRWFTAQEGPAVPITHQVREQPFPSVLRCDQCTRTQSGTGVAIIWHSASESANIGIAQ